MARELGDLPGREIAEDFRGLVPQLVTQARDLVVDIERTVVAGVTQLLDLAFQLGDRLFKIEEVRVHSATMWCKVAKYSRSNEIPLSGRSPSASEAGRKMLLHFRHFRHPWR